MDEKLVPLLITIRQREKNMVVYWPEMDVHISKLGSDRKAPFKKY